MALGTVSASKAMEQVKRPGAEASPAPGMGAGVSVHLLVEMWHSPFPTLADARVIEKALGRAGRDIGVFPDDPASEVRVHQFSPYGVSGTASTPDAHILIHTWPESKYAAIDIYARGRDSAYQMLEQMKQDLKPGQVHVLELQRGNLIDMEDT